jgi:protein involved in polysaccharide export with SLBB domain
MKGVLLGILFGLAVASCARGREDVSGGQASIPAQPDRYAVRGEVAEPGDRPWTAGITLSAAIEKAGGLTPSAAAMNVNLVRMQHVTIHDLGRIRAGEATDTPLMAGDVITVPRRLER